MPPYSRRCFGGGQGKRPCSVSAIVLAVAPWGPRLHGGRPVPTRRCVGPACSGVILPECIEAALKANAISRALPNFGAASGPARAPQKYSVSSFRQIPLRSSPIPSNTSSSPMTTNSTVALLDNFTIELDTGMPGPNPRRYRPDDPRLCQGPRGCFVPTGGLMCRPLRAPAGFGGESAYSRLDAPVCLSTHGILVYCRKCRSPTPKLP
jgi:hypothetical protein